MKRILLTIFILVALSCSKEESARNANVSDLKDYSKDFQKLAITYDHVFHGHDLKDTKETIKSSEKAQLDLENEEHLDYTLILEESKKEFANFFYKFNESDQLIAFNVHIVVHSNEKFEVLLAEFNEYFEHKYGLPTTIDGKGEIWKIKNHLEHKIVVSDIVDGEEYVININIS